MILDEIAQASKVRVAELKKKVTENEIRRLAEDRKKEEMQKGFVKHSFLEALTATGISFICEVKKASPSKGVIVKDFPYLEIAKEYDEAGASAISVLTEPKYFLGSDAYLEEIAKIVSIPVLRKDFTVDVYQIYEAKCLGASTILLISELLELSQIKEYIAVTKDLGMDALVESHAEPELEKALNAGAEIIGVNNRDLKTFEVDLQTSIRLRKLVPKEKIFVSESGIGGSEDIKILKKHGIDAVLIGETLMRSANKKQTLTAWKKI